MEMQKEIERLDREIQAAINLITTLVNQQRNPKFITLEFRRFVELVTDKHELLLEQLLTRKPNIDTKTYNTLVQQIKDSYQDYITSIGVSIEHEINAQKYRKKYLINQN